MIEMDRKEKRVEDSERPNVGLCLAGGDLDTESEPNSIHPNIVAVSTGIEIDCDNESVARAFQTDNTMVPPVRVIRIAKDQGVAGSRPVIEVIVAGCVMATQFK